ncbi:MAG: SRPBCC domain-containing protein, partial [Acidovorax sp.]|nr:SRPBCC domain-containing protein [Acidovorax sp.]
MSTTAYAHGELDREIVLTRVINAPRERVFRAWSEPERMFQWFGPEGFRCE